MDKKKLAVIHIVKKELSLSDDEYRNILERVTGVRTAKDLTDNQFHKLMRYFVRTRHYRGTSKGITLRQEYYLRQLKERLQWDDDHFQNYIHKYFHNWELKTYTSHDASNLIVALQSILKSSPDKKRRGLSRTKSTEDFPRTKGAEDFPRTKGAEDKLKGT